MTTTTTGNTPFQFLSPIAAVVLLAALVLSTLWIEGLAGGRTLVFALVTGAVLGLVLQRSRFCFYCHARDWFEDGNPRGLLAIVLALAVGLVGLPWCWAAGCRCRSRASCRPTCTSVR